MHRASGTSFASDTFHKNPHLRSPSRHLSQTLRAIGAAGAPIEKRYHLLKENLVADRSLPHDREEGPVIDSQSLGPWLATSATSVSSALLVHAEVKSSRDNFAAALATRLPMSSWSAHASTRGHNSPSPCWCSHDDDAWASWFFLRDQSAERKQQPAGG